MKGWGGPEQATAIGTGLRIPPAAAALVNGTLAHSLDFDEPHLPSVLHPSSSVVPAALAVAEATGARPTARLDGIGAGIEVTVRLEMGGYDRALGNSAFFERGQHAASICGAVGAAVAAAAIGDLGEDGIAHAAGIAASMGSGLLEANRTGGTVKRVHCGWAAHSGVVAAELAEHGMTGPPTVVEGRFGFLYAHCGDAADADAVVAGLGEQWELPGIFFKPYPCNHFTHAGIDAALQLRTEGVIPTEVECLELSVPSPVLRTIAEPPEEAEARPDRATTRRSAARTRWPRRSWAVVAWVSDMTTSPMQQQPSRNDWRWPLGSGASLTPSAMPSSLHSSPPCCEPR